MINVPFVVLDSIAILLVIIPMPWHVSAWNTATCYMMIWTVLGCIIHLVDAILWADNIADIAPTYCDISTKILMGLSIAIPLSSLCINRRLYNIASMKTITIGKAFKKRDAIIDTLVAVLGPLIFMAVHYTQQGHRYDVIENFGCWPTTYLTVPGYILVVCPPILVCAISLVYCTLSIRAFLIRRHEFNSVLRTTSPGLNSNRYFRLMALATSEILIGLPTSIYFLISNLKESGVQPWISWSDTHWEFSRVVYWPVYFLRLKPGIVVGLEFNRWAFPCIAILFFIFFGLGQEARGNYHRAFYAVLKPFGIRPRPVKSGSTNSISSKPQGLGRFPSSPVKRMDDNILPPSYFPSSEDYSSSSKWLPSLYGAPAAVESTATVAGDITDQRTEKSHLAENLHRQAVPPTHVTLPTEVNMTRFNHGRNVSDGCIDGHFSFHDVHEP